MRENYTKTLIKTHKTVKVHVEKDWLSELPRPSAPVKKQKVPRPHPMKGKMKKHTSGAQRWKALKLHREDPKSNYAPPYAISRWKKQEADLLKRPIKELQSKNYFLKKESDVRLTGVFPQQQMKTLRKLEKRRGQGKPVSTKWIRNTMFLTCVQDRPPKFDPSKKSQFGQQWVSNYQDSHVYVVEPTKRKLAFLNDCIRFMVSMLAANMIRFSMKFPQKRKSHLHRKSHLPQKINHSHSMNLLRI